VILYIGIGELDGGLLVWEGVDEEPRVFKPLEKCLDHGIALGHIELGDGTLYFF